MFSWLLVSILSYFFFSLAYLGDKLVLAGSSKPRSYTFYIGLLSVLVVAFIPFISFSLPTPVALCWMTLEGIVYIAGLYVMFLALQKFEVSSVMTTIGAVQPIVIFILSWIFWGFQPITPWYVAAFILLLLGSVLISFKKKSERGRGYLTITLLAAVLFSLDYIFSKLVFLDQPFLQGFIWMRIVSFIMVLFFLISHNFRKEIFAKQNVLSKKTRFIFLGTQIAGGFANLLQSFAIFLAPIAFLPMVNALRGIQYVFLFLLVLFFTIFLPKILTEQLSKKIMAQKVVAIILIVTGLAIISL